MIVKWSALVVALSLSCAAVVIACTGDDPTLSKPASSSGGSTSGDGTSGTTSSGASGTSGSGTSGNSSSGSTSSSSSSSGSAGLCPLGCLPTAPPEWTGPSAVYSGARVTTIPPCGGEYTIPEVVDEYLHLTQTAKPAQCACGSSTPNGVCEITVEKLQAGCMDPTGSPPSTLSSSPTGVPTKCMPIGNELDEESFKIPAPKYKGSCGKATVTSTRPPLDVDRQMVACGHPKLAECPARPDCTSTPLPLVAPFNRLCIHRAGDHQCPAGYGDRVVVTKIDDTRSCSDCDEKFEGSVTCPAVKPRQGSCNGAPVTGGSTGCFQGKAPGSSGSPSGSDVTHIELPGPQGLCTATTAPTGEVKTLEPVTFCCAE